MNTITKVSYILKMKYDCLNFKSIYSVTVLLSTTYQSSLNAKYNGARGGAMGVLEVGENEGKQTQNYSTS